MIKELKWKWIWIKIIKYNTNKKKLKKNIFLILFKNVSLLEKKKCLQKIKYGNALF